MTRAAIGLKGAGALFWLLYVWLLSRLLAPEVLGAVLYALGLAGVAGTLAAAGWAQLLLRRGSRCGGEPRCLARLLGGGLRAALRGGALAAALILAASLAGALPFGPAAAALGAGAAVLQSVTAVLAAAQRARGRPLRVLLAEGPLRPGLPAALTALAALQGAPDATTCLALFAAGQVPLLLALRRGLPRPGSAQAGRREARTLWQAQAGWHLFASLDLIAAGALLPPAEAGAYLVARRVAGLAGLVFDALRIVHAPSLARAFAGGRGRDAAEACNRRFLTFGAATIAALAVAAPTALEVLGAGAAADGGTLAGLLAVQSAPALFGAFGMTLTMADMEAARRTLVWLAILPATLLLATLGGDGAAALALSAAAAHGLHAAAAAAILGRTHRIRPGLAAVFALPVAR